MEGFEFWKGTKQKNTTEKTALGGAKDRAQPGRDHIFSPPHYLT